MFQAVGVRLASCSLQQGAGGATLWQGPATSMEPHHCAVTPLQSRPCVRMANTVISCQEAEELRKHRVQLPHLKQGC